MIAILLLLLMLAKDTACVWGLVNQMRRGGAIASRLDAGRASQAEFDAYVTRSNSVDLRLGRMSPSLAQATLTTAFRSW
jgi:hypothetical protein